MYLNKKQIFLQLFTRTVEVDWSLQLERDKNTGSFVVSALVERVGHFDSRSGSEAQFTCNVTVRGRFVASCQHFERAVTALILTPTDWEVGRTVAVAWLSACIVVSSCHFYVELTFFRKIPAQSLL